MSDDDEARRIFARADAGVAAALPELLALARADDRWHRRGAIARLGRLGGREALPALLAALDDVTTGPHKLSDEVPGSEIAEDELVALFDREGLLDADVALLLERLERAPVSPLGAFVDDPSIASTAAVLVRLGPRAIPFIQGRFSLIGPAGRARTLLLLRALDGSPLVELALAGLRDADLDVQRAAVSLSVTKGAPQLFAPLLARALSPEGECDLVRLRELGGALAATAREGDLPKWLGARFDDPPSERAREALDWGLVRFAEQGHARREAFAVPLVDRLWARFQSLSQTARGLLTRVEKDFPSPHARERGLSALREGGVLARRGALHLLGALGDPTTADAFMAALDDSDADTRARVIQYSPKLAEARHLPRLQAFLQERGRSPEEILAARRTIESLAGLGVRSPK